MNDAAIRDAALRRTEGGKPGRPRTDDAQRWGARRLMVLAALAVGATDRDAAHEAKVSANTVKRWKKQPAFAQAIQTMFDDQRQRIVRKLGAVAEKSAAMIEEALTTAMDKEGNADYDTRLKAASVLLTSYTKLAAKVDESGAPPSNVPLISFPPGSRIAVLAQTPEDPAPLVLPTASRVAQFCPPDDAPSPQPEARDPKEVK
jgi:hypothetical protein